MIIPGKKNVAQIVQFPLIDSANRPNYKTSATGLAAKVSSYNAGDATTGTWTASTNTVTEKITPAEGMYFLVVSQAEKNYDYIDIKITGTGVDNQTIKIDTTLHQQLAAVITGVNVTQISGDSTAADNAELAFDGTGFGFTNCTMPTTTTIDSTGLAAIWGYSTRTLTAFSTGLAVSVWDVLESAITTASSIGLKLKTNLDAAITTRSSHSAADVWTATTRALTDKAGFSISGTKTTLDALNDISTADVNSQVDAALDTAIPGTPTANSINERVKAIDDKLPTNYLMGSSVVTDKDDEIDTLITRIPAEVAQKAHFVNGTGDITPPTDKGIWDSLGDGSSIITTIKGVFNKLFVLK